MDFIFSTTQFRGHRDLITCIDIYYQISDSMFENPTIITGSNDKTIRLWNFKTGKSSQCISNPVQISESVGSMAMYDNHMYFSNGNSLSVYDTRVNSILLTKPKIHIQNVCDDEISSIAITNDGKYIAYGSDDGIARIFDRIAFEPKITLVDGHTNIIGAISFRPTNSNICVNELVTGGFDCKVIIWDYINGCIKSQYQFSAQLLNPPFVHALSYMFDGEVIACALGDGSIRLCDANDLAEGSIAEVHDAHSGMITCMSVTHDNTLFTAGVDRTIKIWRVTCKEAADTAADSAALPTAAAAPTTTHDRQIYDIHGDGSPISSLASDSSAASVAVVDSLSKAVTNKCTIKPNEGNDNNDNDTHHSASDDRLRISDSNNNSNSHTCASTNSKLNLTKGQQKKLRQRKNLNEQQNKKTTNKKSYEVTLLHTIDHRSKVNCLKAMSHYSHDLSPINNGNVSHTGHLHIYKTAAAMANSASSDARDISLGSQLSSVSGSMTADTDVHSASANTQIAAVGSSSFGSGPRRCTIFVADVVSSDLFVYHSNHI